jgi:hypothetical protein
LKRAIQEVLCGNALEKDAARAYAMHRAMRSSAAPNNFSGTLAAEQRGIIDAGIYRHIVRAALQLHQNDAHQAHLS